MSNPLLDVAADLLSGAIKVVDLSVTLNPNTPILQLPEEFGWKNAWPFSMEEISRYDERGPAWYWNNIKCGEHTGTHFDAPIHWVTGKDHENHATDTLPPATFVAPCVVIDATADAAADEDFLLTREYLENWEATHGQIPQRSWVLYRTDWSKRSDPESFLNRREDGNHNPGWDPAAITFLAEERDVSIPPLSAAVLIEAAVHERPQRETAVEELIHRADEALLVTVIKLPDEPTSDLHRVEHVWDEVVTVSREPAHL